MSLIKLTASLSSCTEKNDFLTPELRRLLCNALIQPHFDYASSAWYTNLNKGIKEKLQIMQNKCIRFCLKKKARSHVGLADFTSINWLPVNHRVNQCISSNVFKFFNDLCPTYMEHVFSQGEQRRSTRRSFQKLNLPLRKTVQGQRTLSYVGPCYWNQLPNEIKACKTTNGFKHALKRHIFSSLETAENDIFAY